MKFMDDLKFGESYQSKFLEYLRANYDVVNSWMPVGKFKDFDLKIEYKDKTVLYEVKSDRWTRKTGNFCIEYECNGQLSGVSSTKADFYVYYVVGVTDDLYIIPIQDLKKMIGEKKYHSIKSGGDRGMSQFYLINKDLFKKYLI